MGYFRKIIIKFLLTDENVRAMIANVSADYIMQLREKDHEINNLKHKLGFYDKGI